jgi:UDP-3-O-[3-hydroxymyristoyl] glucosamine N-acyltransferase
MPFTISQIAEKCNAKIMGGNSEVIITSASSINNAGPNQITLLTDKRYFKYLAGCRASACFVNETIQEENVPDEMALLVCKDPEMAFLDITNLLHPLKQWPRLIDKSASICKSANLGNALYIGPYAIIEENSSIGDNSDILSGAYVGRNVTIGNNCRIHPYAVIYDDVKIGNNVIIHSGSIIGADGFGYKRRNDKQIKVPQIGTVVIEDDVEIGANTCVDRGTFGNTYIRAGTKIDNLVQIGHNDDIGRNVIICGHSGVAGSCTVEDNATLAAGSGIADHLHIGKNAIVLARSGVANDVGDNEIVFGTPAKDKRVAWREIASVSKIPELMKKIAVLEDKIMQLETMQKKL